MRWFPCALLLALIASARASNQINIADDDADQGMYGGSWEEGSGGDNGFFAWKFESKTDGEESFAGHCLSEKKDHEGLDAITSGRAFALFANGRGHEESFAVRGIAAPLEPGDNFSVDIFRGPFEKADNASLGGEAGVVYHAAGKDASAAAANGSARLKFYARAGAPNYLISDAESEFDTGIPVSAQAVALTLTVGDGDTYDLEVIGSGDHARKLIEHRKFGGPAGRPVNGLMFFAKDSEGGDLFFNNLRLNRNAP